MRVGRSARVGRSVMVILIMVINCGVNGCHGHDGNVMILVIMMVVIMVAMMVIMMVGDSNNRKCITNCMATW